eukprot:TRINITY_DN66439_c0_g1_i1.p1 TRINITY_DN66439_c0_g1~~TRINITY_DN66439_c0_g1_i1.p1  ORF type:complete len:240 (+),score=37.37 TRINITY_DN66439_c0_g1_i1:60-779(+)
MKVSYSIVALCSLLPSATCSNDFGEKFLAENKFKEGVVEMSLGGPQYKVLRKGNSIKSPTLTSKIHIAQKCWTAEKFAEDKPFEWVKDFETEVDGGIRLAGLRMVIDLMVEGDSFQVYMPSAYALSDAKPEIAEDMKGLTDAAQLTGKETIICNLDLKKVLTLHKIIDPCDVKTLENCEEKQKVYLNKKTAQGPEGVAEELARLKRMNAKSMTPDAAEWLSRRTEMLQKWLDRTPKNEL